MLASSGFSVLIFKCDIHYACWISSNVYWVLKFCSYLWVSRHFQIFIVLDAGVYFFSDMRKSNADSCSRTLTGNGCAGGQMGDMQPRDFPLISLLDLVDSSFYTLSVDPASPLVVKCVRTPDIWKRALSRDLGYLSSSLGETSSLYPSILPCFLLSVS